MPSKDVALLPLPVKPVNVGNGQFFEPEKSKIADLLYTWWGVRSDNVNKPTRVLIYNGAGKPGIAGDAARDLISAGFTVVDTKNADRFDYDKTEVLIFPGRSPAEAERVIGTLKVGSVKQQALDQDITDIIVIIGRDYAPPGKEG